MSLVAFVTGASGFVGSHLVRELDSAGWQVHILARTTSSLQDIGTTAVTIHHGDVTDPSSIASSIPRGADAVFHAAASVNLWSARNAEQSRVNIEGTRNLLQAARAAGARRFVHTSSFVAWGFQERVIAEESPRSNAFDWINYVRSKHLSEQLVLDEARNGGIDAVVLNPGNVLGPGDRHNWSRLFRLIRLGKLPGAPPGGGNFCDVREVAKAHVQAWHRGKTAEKYLLGGEFARYLEVIRIAGQMLGCRVPKRPTPGWLLALTGRVSGAVAAFTGVEPDLTPESAAIVAHTIRCDSGKAERELGYRSAPLRNMIQETINWMDAEGLLQ